MTITTKQGITAPLYIKQRQITTTTKDRHCKETHVDDRHIEETKNQYMKQWQMTITT